MKKLPIKTIIVCVTVVLLALIGSWVYVQKQKIEQKDRLAKVQQAAAAKQAAENVKKLKYQECQTNNRRAFNDKSTFSSLLVNNCDLIL